MSSLPGYGTVSAEPQQPGTILWRAARVHNNRPREPLPFIWRLNTEDGDGDRVHEPGARDIFELLRRDNRRRKSASRFQSIDDQPRLFPGRKSAQNGLTRFAICEADPMVVDLEHGPGTSRSDSTFELCSTVLNFSDLQRLTGNDQTGLLQLPASTPSEAKCPARTVREETCDLIRVVYTRWRWLLALVMRKPGHRRRARQGSCSLRGVSASSTA